MTLPRTRGALGSGLDIVERLSQRAQGLGVSELAAELEMDKGNVHRLLHVLAERGYVEQDEATRLYRSSAKIVGVAGAVLRRLDLRSAAESVCDELVEITGESVHVSQMTTGGPVYVLQRRALFRVSVDTEIGSRPPLHCTATGKAVLAFLPAGELEAFVQQPLERFTVRTHTTMDELRRDLGQVRGRGFAIDDEEYGPGVRCVAAPVFGLDGVTVGCIGVSGPVHRMDLDRVPRVAAQVIGAARELTSRLGGPAEAYDEFVPGKAKALQG